MKSCIFGVLAAVLTAVVAAAGLPAGEEALPTGRVIPKVVTRHDPSQSYALYLPRAYTKDRKWPLLYCFSPGAHGRRPVALYQAAAERFGWIVVGSNNSRNGPWAPIKKAIDALWKDTRARFSIDETRIYGGGFSGGARVSCAMTVTMGKPFAGWLPCGAGFSSHDRPGKGGKLAVCGTVGTDDFNYPEMLRLDRTLSELKIRHRLLIFQGPHRWPPARLAFQSVRYMELLARLDRGKVPEARALLKEERADAEALLKTEDAFYRGYRWLKELAGYFREPPEAGPLAARLREIERGERFQKEHAAEEALAALRKRIQAIRDPNRQFETSITAYREFIASREETAAAKRVSVQLAALPRRMGFAGAMLMQRKDYKRAVIYLKRGLLLAPRSANLSYNLACAQARIGKKDAALASLKKAVELGFTDVEHIKKDADLAGLREEKAYQTLIVELEKPGQR